MFKTNFVLMSMCLCITASAGQPAYAQKGKADSLVIATNHWTSQIVLSHILKNTYSELGIESNLKSIDTSKQWGEIPRGWTHIQVEVWEGTMEKMHTRLLKTGNVVNAGTHAAKRREEWWFPYYMKEKCPGLPDWKALKKYSSIFATKTSNGKGRYLGGPWEKLDKARVRALGLDFVIERVEKGDQLWVELKKAYKKKEPIILFNWTLNWVESEFKGEFVNFPDYDPKCETDPKWGVSKKWMYDCGNPKNGWLKKIAWKEVLKRWPCAFKI